MALSDPMAPADAVRESMMETRRETFDVTPAALEKVVELRNSEVDGDQLAIRIEVTDA